MLITLPNTFGNAATNMAIDASLLETLPEGIAVFRHYGWIEPSITFGYSQPFNEVRTATSRDKQENESEASTLTFCRRLTGGGIVDHRNDWTYALILQKALPAAQLEATQLYEQIHRAISNTLRQSELTTSLAPCPRHCDESPGQANAISRCFVSPAANDVLGHDGRKIAGAALKRTRQGLLVQGSLDRGALPDAFEFDSFQGRLIQEFASTLKLSIDEPEDLRPLFRAEVIEEKTRQFQSEAWNQKR